MTLKNTILSSDQKWRFNSGVILSGGSSAAMAILVSIVNPILNDGKYTLAGIPTATFAWVLMCLGFLRVFSICKQGNAMSDRRQGIKLTMIVVGLCLLLGPFIFWLDITRRPGYF